MAQTTDSLSAIRATLAELLEHRHIAPLKHLFWEYLQFEKKQTPLPRADLPPDLADSLAEDPLLFATYGELVVINLRLPTPDLPISTERVLVAHLHRAYHRAIFVISNRSQSRWHFVYVQPPPEHSDNDPNAPFSFSRRVIRRLALEVEEDCPFAASRLAQLGRRPASQTGLTEQEEAVEVVFDRNALETQFIQAWHHLFDAIKADLVGQTGDARWAGAHALRILDRCLLDALLQRANRTPGLSLRDAPPLNAPWERLPFGEMFRLESRAEVTIAETLFNQVGDILAQFPLSLVEDTPLERTLVLSPAILGTVYERLGTDRNERADVGLYYTPATEVDLMCRLALVSFLVNRFGEADRNSLYTAVFALEPQDEASAQEALRSLPAGRCHQIRTALSEMRALDPASGSGAFLIGMLRVLDEMQRRLSLVLQEAPVDPAERVRAIIERNLFGVDVQAAALARASVRLWCAWVSRQGDLEGPSHHPVWDSGELQPRPNLACANCFFLPALRTAFASLSEDVAGVDLVIGNPPYVRHERLRDPCLPDDQAGQPEAKRAYKRALAEQITRLFPYFFPGGKHRRSLNGKSDLYLYFFFLGLALLNERGVLCYVTPNTWLDVEYGTILQEFFLRHCRLELIIDNQMNSSFVEAAVNTIITLASAPVARPKATEEWNLLVRFIALWMSFEQTLHAGVLQEITQTQTHHETVHFRSHPISHLALFEDGCQ
jgi:Eco57I restriction-modification methylase